MAENTWVTGVYFTPINGVTWALIIVSWAHLVQTIYRFPKGRSKGRGIFQESGWVCSEILGETLGIIENPWLFFPGKKQQIP